MTDKECWHEAYMRGQNDDEILAYYMMFKDRSRREEQAQRNAKSEHMKPSSTAPKPTIGQIIAFWLPIMAIAAAFFFVIIYMSVT